MGISNKKNSFIMGTLILGAAGVVIKLLGAVFRIPLTYLISAEGMGYLSLIHISEPTRPY